MEWNSQKLQFLKAQAVGVLSFLPQRSCPVASLLEPESGQLVVV
jgi:hypothetical protein